MSGMQKILQWKHSREAVALLLALLLYVMGIKLLLLPVIILLNARYMPMPSVFRSWFARIFGGVLWAVVLLQVAATIQFLVWPASNFQFLALLIVLVHIVVWRFVPVQEQLQRKLFDMADVGATIVGLVFLIPFAPMLLGGNAINGIAQIGGIQAIDATNHYAGTAVMEDLQHLDYEPGSYYPKGFHISEAFVEGTVFNGRDSLGWQGNAILFLTQYLVMGLAMAYTAYYFVLSLLGALGYKLASLGSYFLVAACLAPCLAIFYLLTFVNEGFLNYYYVIANVLFGFAYLVDLGMNPQSNDDWQRVFTDKTLRWMVVLFLMMVYGVSMSWTLLMPPLVVSAILFVTPLGLNIVDMVKMLFTKQGLPILLAILMQLIPVYFQLRYTADDAGGITATGGFNAYHPFVLLLGVAVVMAFVWSKNISTNFRSVILNLYLPAAAFAMILVAALYFATGEVRYYAIKTSVLFEVMTLVIVIVGMLYAHSRSGVQGLKYAWMLPVVPLVAMMLLTNTTTSPLKGIRDLFRTYSHAPKPEFYDHDLRVYADLGGKGYIQHFNSTLLHYNKNGDGKLYAHMQIPFWSNMMMLGTGQPNYDAMYCNRDLYTNIGFGNLTDAEQGALKLKVRECAKKAHERGLKYYIVTDEGSAETIKVLFGDVAEVVY
jgi:hypothetical protein